MNKQELDIMLALSAESYVSQRFLSEQTGYSLGFVNRCIKNLTDKGYLDEEKRQKMYSQTVLPEMQSFLRQVLE